MSSTVWCMSMCRSPLASTLMSNPPWRAKLSSMWSKKPMPVAIVDAPRPSRSSVTRILVSLVSRMTEAVRFDGHERSTPRAAARSLRETWAGGRSGRSPRRRPSDPSRPQSSSGLPRARPNRNPAAYWSPAPVVSTTFSTGSASTQGSRAARQDHRALFAAGDGGDLTRPRSWLERRPSNSAVSNRASQSPPRWRTGCRPRCR